MHLQNQSSHPLTNSFSNFTPHIVRFGSSKSVKDTKRVTTGCVKIAIKRIHLVQRELRKSERVISQLAPCNVSRYLLAKHPGRMLLILTAGKTPSSCPKKQTDAQAHTLCSLYWHVVRREDNKKKATWRTTPYDQP